MSSYLGQNFLTDISAQEYILQTVSQLQSSHNLTKVIEIWPGKWALTQWLISIFSDVTLIEMDTTMRPYLEKLHQIFKTDQIKSESNNFSIVWWDILKQWPVLSQFIDKEHTLVYWSLPYYITSPIFRLVMIESWFYYGLFIIQKEVWDKISSSSHKKSYLWRLLNNEFEVTITQSILPSSFTPAPKVHSCVVQLTRRSEPFLDTNQYNRMIALLDQISGFKRKTLGKIWKIINRNDLDPQLAPLRLEECWRDEMKKLLINSSFTT